jgi:hypothetical protein
MIAIFNELPLLSVTNIRRLITSAEYVSHNFSWTLPVMPHVQAVSTIAVKV